ncbi:acetyl-CoA carboxylase biotin carboxyl carrier protein subunit [Desulfobacula sp.]|uniref:acetyl-CoA carboxylase biotin carboxyl carrier protein subunit n=1 Tax=Desulfobacula sp. TaxID=2593537 RepID=UPI00263114C4|nr:acetyl-CoA carboxylase biotin carboxyl carrier protein subunit [Desulfobacula sp.]
MATEVLAPLPGKIIRINIEPNATVVEDLEIMVIEAMKMETPIYAPCDGVIEKMLKKEGDEVEEDDLLALIG